MVAKLGGWFLVAVCAIGCSGPDNTAYIRESVESTRQSVVEAWTPVSDWTFATNHPYANNQTVWRQLYLPQGATKVRLLNGDRFDLEANHDFLEVWSWSDGAWKRVMRCTGFNGPLTSDVFVGQYHYVRFASDASVVRYGFDVTAEWSQ